MGLLSVGTINVAPDNAICIIYVYSTPMCISEDKLEARTGTDKLRDVADRVTVDIEGLREQIETAYPEETFWSELSLVQKLRRLIQDGLEKAENTRIAHKHQAEASDSD